MYKLIAIAGTFDRIHKGHKFFISQAFKHGEKVIIGLTSDRYTAVKSKIQNPKSKSKDSGKNTSDGVPQALLRGGGVKIQSYSIRKKELEEFLKSKKLLYRAQITEINDVYGPAAENNEIEALLVTRETMEGARLVNKRRQLKQLKKLKIIKVPLINADDKKRIASTRIRMGEIDRFGKVFLQLVQNSSGQDKFKPIRNSLRRELKKPQGELIKGDINNLNKIVPELKTHILKLHPVMISTIGDEVTRVCNKAGLMPELAIFDYKVNREKVYNSYQELGISKTFTKALSRPGLEESILTVLNPAGNISGSIVRAVQKAIKGIIFDGRQRLIRVKGEDDLAGVPAILLSPLGSVVIYGQPGQGVVVVEVTEEKKNALVNLIQDFSIK